MKFVHLHIPKTAGTSLRESINAAHRDLNVRYVTVADDISEIMTGKVDIVSGHISYDQAIHYCDSVVTVLRHPIDRFVSVYYFWRQLFASSVEDTRKTRLASTLSLYEFSQAFDEPELVSELFNRTTWQIHSDFRLGRRYDARLNGCCSASDLVEGALENLRSFSVVGFQGKFEKFVEDLNDTFSLNIVNTEINTTRSRIRIEDLNRREISSILKWVEIDMDLYERALSEFYS